MLFAKYNGKEYECASMRGGKKYKLLSEHPVDGFSKGLSCYTKIVSREECSKVYKKEMCFKYKGDSFLIIKENGNKILLESGPRSYDLKALGFDKILNDTFQKWVEKKDGEIYLNETQY